MQVGKSGESRTSLGTASWHVADAADDKNRTQALALFRSGGDRFCTWALAGTMSSRVYKCRFLKFFISVS